MPFRRLAPLARRVAAGVARPAAALAGAGLLAVAAAETGLVTPEDLGPLMAGPEVAADRVPAVAAPPSSLDQLPAVDHAGLRIALVEARTVPDNPTGLPIVVVDLAVRSRADRQVRLTRPMLRLVDSEERATEVTRFDYSTRRDRLVVDPGTTARALAVFVLPEGADADLGLHRLEIGEPGRWPSFLPLGGEVPVDVPAVPVEPLPVPGSADPTGYRGVTLTPAAATVGVEYGIYRARIDQRVLAVEVDVEVGVDSGAEAVARLADSRHWDLLARPATAGGEATRQPALRVILDDPGPTGSVTLTAVFTFPTDAVDLVVVFDADGDLRPVARFEVQPAG
jgi:hypothetical protein